ncbi:Eco29kI family restriction endonuclease [Oricola nitratireducens]|uniref:Eco29kI family restriction endonuclease n=1 Tax=Oricola nitratireducens TaxID=2775868 RepID=UPI0018667B89|nr:Eco29kI family restriction endonuclease [Oricola nitratireducens]
MSRRGKARKPRQTEIIEGVRAHLEELEGLASGLSNVASRKTRELLVGEVREDLARVISSLDPIKEPKSFFDPADPETAGRLVAMALLAQPRVPLGRIPRSYGSGVYAIYYNGRYPAYLGISGTEMPIYVGKADPSSTVAVSPREQGDKLYGRLADHRKAIRTVEKFALDHGLPNPLRVEDFECRRLVTATNAQLFAEKHLIGIFEPIWNKDTNVCWGISKHGDTEGRSNKRSPWDVLHKGRKWAMQEKLEDSRSEERILEDIRKHTEAKPAYTDRDEIVEAFLSAFAQDPLLDNESDAEDDGGDDEG